MEVNMGQSWLEKSNKTSEMVKIFPLFLRIGTCRQFL
jgi:hypothetical protein